jgi:hypothetical protein
MLIFFNISRTDYSAKGYRSIYQPFEKNGVKSNNKYHSYQSYGVGYCIVAVKFGAAGPACCLMSQGFASLAARSWLPWRMATIKTRSGRVG